MSVFNKIQLKKPPRSSFDLSYDHKLSLKMGKLVPVHIQECLPGDKFTISSEAMLRMMTMIAPIMHPVEVYIHHWFVPNRIIWPNWDKFITGGERTGLTPPVFPTMDLTELNDIQPSTLANYLGLPCKDVSGLGQDVPISALPFAAYQRIWAEYYRDENLEPLPSSIGMLTSEDVKLADGIQSGTTAQFFMQLRDRAWEHDYFTSCLPFAQKGASVEIPLELGGTVPLDYSTGPNGWRVRDAVTGNLLGAGDVEHNLGELYSTQTGDTIILDPFDNLFGDLANATVTNATTINDLRLAMSVQKFLERSARGGSRYTEAILAHFGVRSSDKRLQRPEYIGGSRASMAISEVLQTSATDPAATPQGTMAGHGISIAGGHDGSYFCEEHGYIIGILSVRPRTAYYQGIPRHFSKLDKFDYYWPDLAFLGEDTVRNFEVYADDTGATNPYGTFGYIPRYSEYRYNNSRVSGQMADTLDYWHLGRKFSSMPSLNNAFVQCQPDKRIFADVNPNDDEIVAHIYHKIRASRPLPMYGTPGGI